ncbi:hypothetical protein TgHK011_008897 [Trichoderma gracile]|nr:hypothetical protein TgHK011_008897 [Trichoderma gracile]
MNNKTVIKMLMLVLKHNVDADYKEARGDTPLMEATTSHRGINTGKLFLQSPRVNLNQWSHWGEMVLHTMIAKGRPDIAELMLTRDGIETDQWGFKGHTAQMVCLLKMVEAANMSLYIPQFK